MRYSDFAEFVKPFVKKASNAMVRNAAREGVVKFCAISQVFRDEKRFETIPDDSILLIDHPGNTFSGIREIGFDYSGFADFGYGYGHSDSFFPIHPRYFDYTTRETPELTSIDLSRLFRQANYSYYHGIGQAPVIVRYYLQPSRSGNEFPDLLYERYGQGLVISSVGCMDRSYWRDPGGDFARKGRRYAIDAQIDDNVGYSAYEPPIEV